jgi:transposase
VEPFKKRHKNDAIDAEAICEEALRPGMRFVAVKSEEQQAAGLVFRTRDLVVRQRTQLINAIRGHLAEYGGWPPRGTAHMMMLADLLKDEEMTSTLPEAAQRLIARRDYRMSTDGMRCPAHPSTKRSKSLRQLSGKRASRSYALGEFLQREETAGR